MFIRLILYTCTLNSVEARLRKSATVKPAEASCTYNTHECMMRSLHLASTYVIAPMPFCDKPFDVHVCVLITVLCAGK